MMIHVPPGISCSSSSIVLSEPKLLLIAYLKKSIFRYIKQCRHTDKHGADNSSSRHAFTPLIPLISFD